MKNNKWKRIVWAVMCLVAVVLIVLSQLEYIPNVGIRTMLGFVIVGTGIASIVSSGHGFVVIAFGLGFLRSFIGDYVPEFENFNFFALLMIGFLLEVAFGLLTGKRGIRISTDRKKNNHHYSSTYGRYGSKDTNINKDTIYENEADDASTRSFYTGSSNGKNSEKNSYYISAKLGSVTKYIVSDEIDKVFIETNMGSAEVFFKHCAYDDSVLEIVVDVNVGNAEIYLPAEWDYTCDVNVTLGNIDEIGQQVYVDNPRIVHITGSTRMGNLEITRI